MKVSENIPGLPGLFMAGIFSAALRLVDINNIINFFVILLTHENELKISVL